MAMAFGWFARGLDWSPEEPRPRASSAAAPAAMEGPGVVPVRVDVYAPTAHDARGSRNLFAYREREATPARIAIAPPVAPPAIVTSAPEPVAYIEPPAPFSFSYIGTIGPDHDPIAVFSRDGEIVNVRRGERIDDTFVLRTIGIESVEVEDARGRRRIPLANPG